MKFEYDVYISYSRKDNLILPGSDKGWVSNFQRFLEIRLSQLLGQKAKFISYGNGEKPTAAELGKACVMVSILSPEYAKASDCAEDIEVFLDASHKIGGFEIGGKSRIFKAVKFPVPFDLQHSKIRSLLGYDMFETDASGTAKEIDNFFGGNAERNFWMKLDDLAHDLYDLIKEVNIERGKEAVVQTDSVYLAETGFDLTLARDLIKRELQRHGYRVLPDQELPVSVREMESAVRKDLKECKLSIHLIGDSYGDLPVGSEKSIVEIQNQLSAEHGTHAAAIPGATNTKDFNRLIWISPNAKLTNERQKEFIESLKRDAEKMNAAELLQTSLEDLKNIIRNKLSFDSSAKVAVGGEKESASGLPSIYLIYDKVDADAGKNLAQIIENRGNEILYPLLDGELMDVRSKHFDNLRKCDVAMIYYGSINEQWVQMKVLDVLKAPGLGRTKPMLSKTIFVEDGPKMNKANFKNYNISVIENNGNSIVSLEPFMAKINQAK